MKKQIIGLLACAVLIGGLDSCKKGENDPFMSLKSRKARLTGEWEMTSIQGTSSSVNPGGETSTSSTTSSDGLLINVYAFGGNQSSDTTKFSQTITFEKDGTYKMVSVTSSMDETMVSTITEEGRWAFVGKSEGADIKAKEAIHLSSTKITNEYKENGVLINSDVDTYDDNDFGQVLMLDRLSNKELTVTNSSEQSDSDGFKYTSESTINLEKK